MVKKTKYIYLIISLMIAITVVTLARPSRAIAHEGHADAPGFLAPHGGIVQRGRQIDMELVQEGTTLKLYPISHEGKPMKPSEVTITATAKAPKKGKAKGEVQTLKLKEEGEGFTTSVELKNTHRFELEVQTTSAGKKDRFIYQVEPQG